MTPKKKAEYLVELYQRQGSVTIERYVAKQCALIAVNELIDSHLVLTTTHCLEPSIRCKTYWQQVKNEIENM